MSQVNKIVSLEYGKVKPEDIVRELSPEALSYLSSIVLIGDWPVYAATDKSRGKFIRLGDVMVLAPLIGCYNPAESGGRGYLTHRDMVLYGRNQPEWRSRIEQSAPDLQSCLSRIWPLVDAGYYDLQVGDSDVPEMIIFYGESNQLGRSDEEIRGVTGQISEQLLKGQIRQLVR